MKCLVVCHSFWFRFHVGLSIK